MGFFDWLDEKQEEREARKDAEAEFYALWRTLPDEKNYRQSTLYWKPIYKELSEQARGLLEVGDINP